MLGQKYKRTISYALVFLCLSQAINYPVTLNDVILDIAAIYSAWVLMSGRHLFYNSRGHLVPGIGIQNLLPSGRREPD